MRRSRVQGAFRKATHRAGITTRGVAIPTLRPSYATHWLEAGVTPGSSSAPWDTHHSQPPCSPYHLTPKGHADAYERLSALMHGLLL
jgi:hypothetical protein